MERKLFSASEIADMRLPGIPTQRDNVRLKAEREGWYSEERTGRGGRHKAYEIPARYLGGTAQLSVGGQSVPDNVVELVTARQTRLLEISRAVDQWLLESNLALDLDKKYLLIELLDKYFATEKQLDSSKLSEMIRKLA